MPIFYEHEFYFADVINYHPLLKEKHYYKNYPI